VTLAAHTKQLAVLAQAGFGPTQCRFLALEERKTVQQVSAAQLGALPSTQVCFVSNLAASLKQQPFHEDCWHLLAVIL
jgi:hypothetical protein